MNETQVTPGSNTDHELEINLTNTRQQKVFLFSPFARETFSKVLFELIKTVMYFSMSFTSLLFYNRGNGPCSVLYYTLM